jgi:hypothetical protein
MKILLGDFNARVRREDIFYYAYSSILTLQQFYTSNEVQDFAYKDIGWFHKIMAQGMESQVSYGLTLA